MTITLLIDLDDTLLSNDMDIFVPAYLNALGEFMSSIVEPQKLITSLLNATQHMFTNNDIGQTLKNVFDRPFYKQIHVDAAQVNKLIDDFYQFEFKKLKRFTGYKPEATQFVQKAFERNYQIGIATNPLFPLTAIKQRLQWAGFDPDDSTFLLIPSYEDFHFAKPNPAFFAEFITRIGWQSDIYIMIGNDIDHDIQGASNFGIPAFWVNNLSSKSPPNLLNSDFIGQGSLLDFFDWLDEITTSNLSPEFNKPSSLLAQLKGIPAGIFSMCKHATNSAKKSELAKILSEMLNLEQNVNYPTIKRIVTENSPIISQDNNEFSNHGSNNSLDLVTIINEYASERNKTLQLLESIDNDEWNRTAIHNQFGQITLQNIVHEISLHDQMYAKRIFILTKSH